MDKAVVKAINLIEALAKSPESRGITSLADELSLTKSNVHRLLSTLERHGYVQRVPINSTYELSTKLWEIGTRVIKRYDLPKVSLPAMQELAAKTGETIHLSILDKFEVIYIEKIESDHPVRAYTKVGGRASAWCVATGKAMLAYQPAESLQGLPELLHKFAKNTITDMDELTAQFEQVRASKVAYNEGEWRDAVNGVGSPIFDQRGNVKAAIGISGPDTRLSKRAMRRFAPDVIKAAARISHELGAPQT